MPGGIAIALFGMGVFSQLDGALFRGRNTEAAIRAIREIGRGFGAVIGKATPGSTARCLARLAQS